VGANHVPICLVIACTESNSGIDDYAVLPFGNAKVGFRSSSAIPGIASTRWKVLNKVSSVAIDVSWRLDTVADVCSLAQRADDGDGTRMKKRFQRLG
jgi:hypothetical protein